MSLIYNFKEVIVSIHENQPHPLVDPFVPAMSAWSLVTAVSTGIFDIVGDGLNTSESIARRLGIDPGGVRLLLDILVCLGFLESDNHKFSLTEVSRMTLTDKSPSRLKNWVRFCRIQLLAMEQLERALSSGERVDLTDLMKSEDDRRIHQLAMAETATPAAEWVASQIPVPAGSEIMLDIGGSHGIYSVAICKNHPPLRSEIMELPVFIESARSVADELGTSNCVQHFEGDILETELKHSYSLVFLGNLIHHFNADEIRIILRKIFDTLPPGGTVAVWDFAEIEGEANLFSSAFSLFFHMTSRAQCYSGDEMERFLSDSGFTEFVSVKPPVPSPHILYTARKPN